MTPFRVSPSEKEKIRANAEAAGLSLSDFMRQACLDPILVVRENAIDKDFVYHLLKIGNNLNQLTKHANSLKMGYDSKRLHALLDRLEGIITKVL